MLTRRMSRRKGKENAMTQFTDNRNDAMLQDDETTVAYMRDVMAGLVADMAKKGVVDPAASFLISSENMNCHITLSSDFEEPVFNGDYVKHCFGSTFDQCFIVAEKVIADMPDPDPADAVMREYQSHVACAIDYGTEHGLEYDFVAPLRDVSQTISEGLLADQRWREGDEA